MNLVCRVTVLFSYCNSLTRISLFSLKNTGKEYGSNSLLPWWWLYVLPHANTNKLDASSKFSVRIILFLWISLLRRYRIMNSVVHVQKLYLISLIGIKATVICCIKLLFAGDYIHYNFLWKRRLLVNWYCGSKRWDFCVLATQVLNFVIVIHPRAAYQLYRNTDTL